MLSQSAIVRLTDRKILQIKGADAHRFLQSVLTNDMKTVVKPQDAIYGAFLTSKGRVIGDASVVQVEADTFLLDYDASVHDDLTKHWKRYKLRMKATLEDKSDTMSAFAALPAAISASDKSYVESAGELEELLRLNERDTSAVHGAVFRDPRGDAFGLRAILPSADKLDGIFNYSEAELYAYTNYRIFLGAAEGKELADAIPLEADLELLKGVSFRKGCYVGQELTARTQFKGNVRKRFLPVALIPTTAEQAHAVANQPFQRIDAQGLQPLREYLVSDAARLSIPQGEQAIVKPGSAKTVGSIISLGQELGVAVAMMRLEHVLPKEDGETPLMDFTTADGALAAVPFQPVWWPSLDLKTGKMVL